MIKATIRKDGFRIEGHANYAPSGYDIVCAGVSALVGAAEQMLDWTVNECEEGLGLIDVIAPMECNKDRLDGVVLMLYYGLLNIQEQYPSNLEVHYEA